MEVTVKEMIGRVTYISERNYGMILLEDQQVEKICGEVIERINNILYQTEINANLTICNFAKHDGYGIYNLSNVFN